MNGKAFFDTNILVYVVAQQDGRTASAEALVAGGGVVSVQVLNELASVARRKLGMTWDEIGEALGAIRVLCPSPVPLTIETHEAGLRIAADTSFTSTMRSLPLRRSKLSARRCIPRICKTDRSSTGP